MDTEIKNEIETIRFVLYSMCEEIKNQVDKLGKAEDYEDVREIQQELTEQEDKLCNLTSDLVGIANELEDIEEAYYLEEEEEEDD